MFLLSEGRGSLDSKMKTAFVTTYRKINDRILLHNGFSFICHLVKGDHFFVEENNIELEKLRFSLSPYDRIYCSISFLNILKDLSNIIDERWVIGGRVFSVINNIDEKIKRNIFVGSFEKYLGVPTSETFTPYWNDSEQWSKIVEAKAPKTLQYNALCGVKCYWKKCLYCKENLFHDRDVDRNIIKIYRQLQAYHNLHTIVYLYSGSIPSLDLGRLIRVVYKYPIPQVSVRINLRPDGEIRDEIKKAISLFGIHIGIGLETFSQKVSDRYNRGTSIKTSLEIIKMLVEKDASVTLCYMSEIPFMDEEIYEESMKNIEWLQKNIDMKKVHIIDNIKVQWPSEKIASKFGEYIVMGEEDTKNKKYPVLIYSKISKEAKEKCEKIVETLKNVSNYTNLRDLE